MKKVVIFFSIVLLFSSCASANPPRSIRIYDEKAYHLVKDLLIGDFIKQKIEIEIYPSTISLSLFGLIGARTARKIYKRLSLSFRFQDSNPHQQVLLLSEYVADNADITMHAYGFTIDQGSEFITATVLGETDWDNDNISDYILSFRISQKALHYEFNKQKTRIESPTREYILLIRNVDSDVYKAEILLIHDYIRQSYGMRTMVYKNHAGALGSFFQEHVAISYEQGQEQIVFAPDTGEQKKNKSEKEEEEVKRTKLSE